MHGYFVKDLGLGYGAVAFRQVELRAAYRDVGTVKSGCCYFALLAQNSKPTSAAGRPNQTCPADRTKHELPKASILVGRARLVLAPWSSLSVIGRALSDLKAGSGAPRTTRHHSPPLATTALGRHHTPHHFPLDCNQKGISSL